MRIHGVDLARGAAAGAAGTTALHAATYLDMAWRGRPASATPERTVDRLVGRAVPGDGQRRANRLTGLGALGSILAGLAAGAALGGLRGLGWRPGAAGTAASAAGIAMLVGNVPMTVLGISDPRGWSVADWASDLLPHAAYGLAAGATLSALDPPR